MEKISAKGTNSRNYFIILFIPLVLNFIYISTASAKVSKEKAQLLGTILTPFGSIAGGNIDGSIPRWNGGLSMENKTSVQKGLHHTDLFADEKALKIITRQDLDSFAANLTKGQIKMFNSYKNTFSMHIFPTHRTHALPSWINENTKKNALTASLTSNNNGFMDAYGGTPFPVLNGSPEKKAMQVMWNHLTRWRGIYVNRRSAEIPVNRNGQFTPVIKQQEVLFNYYIPGRTYKDLENMLLYYISSTISPARLSGSAILSHEPLDQTLKNRGSWEYNSGQRRVRRAPNLVYDSPTASSNSISTIDEIDMYNGAPDLYHWKYQGLTEKFIPYNNYKINEKGQKYSNILMPGHINPEYVRWEKHRVHVIEATLKTGIRHIFSKRVFYVDEDSWSIAMAEQYDAREELIHFNISLLKNYYDLPGVSTSADVIHDIQSHRYVVSGLYSEESKGPIFLDKAPSKNHFSSSSLRRRGR